MPLGTADSFLLNHPTLGSWVACNMTTYVQQGPFDEAGSQAPKLSALAFRLLEWPAKKEVGYPDPFHVDGDEKCAQLPDC